MSASWESSYDDEEEDLDDFPEQDGGAADKDNVIFAIEVTPLMLVKGEDGMTYFNAALKCAAEFLKKKIIASATDLMGILFFGSKEKKNDLNLENIYLKKAKSASKRIFLITAADNPHGSNSALLKNARTRANDLQEFGITIELFPVDIEGRPSFNFDAFYRTLPGVTGGGLDSVEAPPTASKKYETMFDSITAKEVTKRTAYRIPFKITENLTIGIKGYNLIVEQRKGNYTYLSGQHNAEVRTVTTWVDQLTGNALLPNEMKSYWIYGGDKVVFSKEEVNEIKYFHDPGRRELSASSRMIRFNPYAAGMVLLGFKPREALKFEHNIKHGTFIYPDEEEYKGSSSVFAHLLERMHAKGKIAICRLIARRNMGPRLVALLPEKPDAQSPPDEMQYGFHVIVLPYRDDIRDPALPLPEQAPESCIEAAKGIIRKLYIKNEVQNAVPEMAALSAPRQTKKRAAPASAEGSSNKKQKIIDDATMQAQAQHGKLSTYTIPLLTEFLQNKDIRPAKRKGELIKQVEQYFGV
ncbi:X-ray repair cross-complementing protein 6 [Gaertneriomyces sp. JEL0708]|nr:X-ray repair cross-complementing protein 6 [Gaertneriomyces sp. JEL0708]